MLCVLQVTAAFSACQPSLSDAGPLCPAGIMGLSSFHFAAGLSVVITVPMLLIPTFQKLSWLNLMGFLSTGLVTATVVAAALMDPKRQDQQQVRAVPVQVPRSIAPYISDWIERQLENLADQVP